MRVLWADRLPTPDAVAAQGRSPRDVEVVARLRQGETLGEVGEVFGVTPERIRQIALRTCRPQRQPVSVPDCFRQVLAEIGGPVTIPAWTRAYRDRFGISAGSILNRYGSWAAAWRSVGVEYEDGRTARWKEATPDAPR